MSQKIVITGGPCSGKTSVIQDLKNRGFRTIKEAAREIIKEELEAGSDHLPWKDAGKFQLKVIDRQKKKEGEVEGGEIVFLDRGLIDGVSYLKFNGIEVDLNFWKNHHKVPYKKIFVLDLIPNFETDLERKETEEEAKKLQDLMIESYEDFGYEVVFVPVVPIEERVQFILDRI